jgi:TolA-binding protein
LWAVFTPSDAEAFQGIRMDTAIKPPASSKSSWWDWFMDDFYPRYDKQLWSVIGALVLAAAVYSLWNYNREKSEIVDNKKLGAAYVLMEKGQLPDAEKALAEFLREGLSGIARDKANLLLGKTYYDEQKYDEALAAYGNVRKDKSAPLIYSGALHGQAACYMQKKDYARAAQILDQFLDLYMRRTGNPKEDLVGKEVVDLSPAVPNALLKQALCYRELGRTDKVKADVEKLQKAYPASHEAQDGAKLLATIE